MTDWKYYDSSKYPAKCSYCHAEVPLNYGRWRARKTDDEGSTIPGSWTACANCFPAPKASMKPILPGEPKEEPTEEVEEGSKPLPLPRVVVPLSKTSFTPNSPIAKAHEDNMLSAELTRIELRKLTDALGVLVHLAGTIGALKDCVAEHMHAVKAHTRVVEHLTTAMNARTKILEEQLRKEV